MSKSTIDADTNETETATEIAISKVTGPGEPIGESCAITDLGHIIAFYRHPSAEAWGDGSYIVEIAPEVRS